MKIDFKMDKGWKRFIKAVDPAHMKQAMDRHVPQATMLNAHLMQKEIRESIRSGLFTPNASLTIAIKSSSKPLIDTGHGLFQAVAVEPITNYKVFTGILKTDGFYNIAVAVHNGVTIKVTPKMRGMFFILWQVSEGKEPASKLTGRAAELFSRMGSGWKPLKAGTTAIVIPARPFMVKAWENKELHALIQRNWHAALAASFKDLANIP